MVKGNLSSFMFLCMVAAMVVVQATETGDMAVECDPSKLIGPCGSAFTGGSQPSKECCDKLKEQEPCYCGYLKNPTFKPYIESSNGKRIVIACGFTLPTCNN